MKKPKINRFDLIEVFWWDVQTNPGWTGIDSFKDIMPPLCKTVGYYQECKKENGKIQWIIVSHNVHDADQQADYTVIPFGMIQRMVKIG
jgi:hypothetical protein